MRRNVFYPTLLIIFTRMSFGIGVVSVTRVMISLAFSRYELDYDAPSASADVSKLPFRADGGGTEPGASDGGL